MSETFEMVAKTLYGLEEILAGELLSLGANDIQIGRRMVSFTGDKEVLYKANFYCRTALRILKPIYHFKAKDADTVYKEVKKVKWENYMSLDKTFAIDSVIYSEDFNHSKFVAYRTKDAIVDYFMEKDRTCRRRCIRPGRCSSRRPPVPRGSSGFRSRIPNRPPRGRCCGPRGTLR